MCEELETHQDGSGQLDVLMEQSIVLNEIKAEVLLENDIPSHQNLLLQRYEERIKLYSHENKVSKFCMDAGFMRIVEVGRNFMTKDTGDFGQFRAVACREYTLPREAASQPKGSIQGNTKIGPVLEVATSYLHGKHGVEVRIMFLSRDNTHSWVRISYGTNQFVMNLNNNETEIPEDQLEEYAFKLSAKDSACLALHRKSYPLKEGIGLRLNQGNILSPNTRYR